MDSVLELLQNNLFGRRNLPSIVAKEDGFSATVVDLERTREAVSQFLNTKNFIEQGLKSRVRPPAYPYLIIRPDGYGPF